MTDNVTTTMNALVSCVCEALQDAERPVCRCGLTIGQPVIGLEQCCECTITVDDETVTAYGQVSANLERLYPTDGGPQLEQVARRENCRTGPVAADITLVLTRCYPRLDETGATPTLDDTTGPAEDLNDDMATMWNAIVCCGQNVVIRESGVQVPPEGGCSVFGMLVSVLVKP